MAGDYFCAYHSYLTDLQPFSDEERGRLFMACLLFSATGEDTVFNGNERFIWPSLKSQIERDADAYAKKCKINQDNGKKGGRPPKKETERFSEKPTETERFSEKPTETERFSEKPKKPKEKEKEREKEKENISPLPPNPLLELPEGLQRAAEEWVAYKQERREPYKTTGLKALVSQLKKDAEEKGEAAVIDSIRYSMAQGWKGIYPPKDDSSSTNKRNEKQNAPPSYDIDRAEQKAKTSVPKLVKKQQPGTEKSSSMI